MKIILTASDRCSQESCSSSFMLRDILYINFFSFTNYLKYKIFQWPFGNLGIGTSALASALQKFYLYLTHFFLEKIEYYVLYTLIFFLVQLVLSYLKIYVRFKVTVFPFSAPEICMLRKDFNLRVKQPASIFQTDLMSSFKNSSTVYFILLFQN